MFLAISRVMVLVMALEDLSGKAEHKSFLVKKKCPRIAIDSIHLGMLFCSSIFLVFDNHDAKIHKICLVLLSDCKYFVVFD